MSWTTVPPWLYQNDLPDDQLQEVYVREAEKKLRDLGEECMELERQLAAARAAQAKAAVFVAQAKRALAGYRGLRRG